jgi:hypothetical protein
VKGWLAYPPRKEIFLCYVNCPTLVNVIKLGMLYVCGTAMGTRESKQDSPPHARRGDKTVNDKTMLLLGDDKTG